MTAPPVPVFVSPVVRCLSQVSDLSGAVKRQQTRIFVGWGSWIRTNIDGVRGRCSIQLSNCATYVS